MKIGLYGGTFDPVHLGHIHAALSVREHLQLDEVRMILSARPGHRLQPQTANNHRWKMLELGCVEHSGLVIDDTELQRSGKSYAIDTVKKFRQQYGDTQLCWILGMDSYITLPSWQDWCSLIHYCHIVVVQRPGEVSAETAVGSGPLAAFEQQFRAETIGDQPAGRMVFLELPMLSISASRVRSALAEGTSIADLVSPRVHAYLEQHSLYPTREGQFESR